MFFNEVVGIFIERITYSINLMVIISQKPEAVSEEIKNIKTILHSWGTENKGKQKGHGPSKV